MKPVIQIQWIKKDLSERWYTLIKVEEQSKNFSRKKKIKKLMKKVKNAREKSMKDRMLLLFELGKKMEKDRMKEENKFDKTLAWRIYKSFAVTYP